MGHFSVRRLTVLAVVALALLPGTHAPSQDAKREAEEKVLAEALKKATVKGKCRMLMRQIKVPEDRDEYGDFFDYGPFQPSAIYKGHKDVPGGYWVYVHPHWYVWRDAGAPPLNRAWGPEQATGEPDTPEAGDFPTAWASLSEDGQDEWLMLEYAEPILPKEIVVHETFNPGAVTRVTAFRLDGTEVEVWKGKGPGVGKDRAVSVLPFKGDFRTGRIKLYLASSKVSGWNEIDAVGLKDARGKTFWAVAAEASSTYAERTSPMERTQRIRQRERELSELKNTLRELEEMLDRLEKKK